jgi:hypothetical protein
MRSEIRPFVDYTLPATHEAIPISLVLLALNSENTHLFASSVVSSKFGDVASDRSVNT